VLVRDAWDGSIQDIELEVTGLTLHQQQQQQQQGQQGGDFSESQERAAVASAVSLLASCGLAGWVVGRCGRCCCLLPPAAALVAAIIERTPPPSLLFCQVDRALNELSQAMCSSSAALQGSKQDPAAPEVLQADRLVAAAARKAVALHRALEASRAVKQLPASAAASAGGGSSGSGSGSPAPPSLCE
jgi:hypothetical protein